MALNFKSLQASNRVFLAAASVALGFLIFFWLCGPRCLDPTNIAWTGEGDAGQHYIGWLFYRYSDWTFPVGLSPDWGMENAAGVIHADALPLLAIPFKLFQSWLPEPFQYYGLWFLLCFVLSAFFTMRFLAEYKVPRTVQLLAAVLAAASPILLWRIPGHHSLTGHWFILWALGLVLSPRPVFRWTEWGWLLCMSLAVHPYITIMTLILFVADGTGRELLPLIRSFDRRRLEMDAVKCCVVALLLVFVAWQIGLIGLSNTRAGDGGFGFFKSNLNALVNPLGLSVFMKDWPVHSGEGEGYGYLGFGVLLLLVVASAMRCTLPAGKKIFAVGMKPLATALFIVTLLAVTGCIGLNDWTFKVFDGHRIKAFMVVRSSGRFIWVLWYFLLLSGVLTLAAVWREGVLSTKAFVVLMAGAVLIQATDIHQVNYDGRRKGLMMEKSETFFSADPRWREVAAEYDSLRVLHNPGNAYSQWRDIAYLAGVNHLKTNTGYWTRTKDSAAKVAALDDDEILKTEQFPKRTAYVVTDKDIARLVYRKPEDSTLATLNGLPLLLPHWRGGDMPSEWPALREVISKPEPGRTYHFKSREEAGRKLLAAGWFEAESMGMWSDGQKASLMLAVPEGAGSVMLTVQPFVSAKCRQQRVVIKALDGVVLGEETLTGETDLCIPLDERVLETRDGMRTAFVTLELPDAAKSDVNGESHFLGLRLLAWKVMPQS